jgi:rhodanese-related sulfurtransferase
VSHGGLAWAKSAAERVARKLAIRSIDESALGHLRADESRTLYLFDVRDPAEYAAGHVAGALSAPGGQLVQATDQYAGTLGARIVLVDDKEARAVMTASWLRQMGWRDVFVLVAEGHETGWPDNSVLGEVPRDAAIDSGALNGLLASGVATVVDLSLSRDYRGGHIPGAWFAIRTRLDRALPKISPRGTLVLTSEDGALAALAVAEARALTALPVRVLQGGNAAWKAAGHPLTRDDARMADEPVDTWLKPYERPDGARQAMADYLAWETDLLPRIARDGCANFSAFAPQS